MFTPLNFPKIDLKLSRNGEEIYVWDIFRKRKLLLTPEEWVRQHILHFLVNEKQVPATLISSEHSLKINHLERRCDGVVFNRQGKPVMLIECKQPEVAINEEVFHQIAQYNFKLKVNWLVMTNGLQTVIAFVNQENGEIAYRQEIPSFAEFNQE